MTKPTIGRVVHFWPHIEKDGDGNRGDAGQPHAALIAHVFDDGTLINVGYFAADGSALAAIRVPLVQDGEERPVEGFFAEFPPYLAGAKAAKPAA